VSYGLQVGGGLTWGGTTAISDDGEQQDGRDAAHDGDDGDECGDGGMGRGQEDEGLDSGFEEAANLFRE
jgi:hypothetical protein